MQKIHSNWYNIVKWYEKVQWYYQRQTRFRKKGKDAFFHGLRITGWLCPLKGNGRRWRSHQQFRRALLRVSVGRGMWKRSSKRLTDCETSHYAWRETGVSNHPLPGRTWSALPVSRALSPVSLLLMPFVPNSVVFWLFLEQATHIPASGPTGLTSFLHSSHHVFQEGIYKDNVKCLLPPPQHCQARSVQSHL